MAEQAVELKWCLQLFAFLEHAALSGSLMLLSTEKLQIGNWWDFAEIHGNSWELNLEFPALHHKKWCIKLGIHHWLGIHGIWLKFAGFGGNS